MPNDEKSLPTQLEEKIKKLEEENSVLQLQKNKYENGDAKLYYSIQRKMAEMSISFNKYSLDEIDLSSKSDATFERVFKLLEKCEIISTSAAALGKLAGVTGNEKEDTTKKPFIETIADTRK